MTDQARNGWSRKDFTLLAFSFLPAGFLTWGIHEAAHYLSGIALGYDMWMTFNQVGLVEGEYDSGLHEAVVSMAGPVITWVQAIVAFYFVRSSQQLWAYSFLFLTFWTRFLAMIFSYIAMLNDEARVSEFLNLPIFVVPSISVGIVLAFTCLGSLALQAGWKSNLIAVLSSAAVTALIIFSDQMIFYN